MKCLSIILLFVFLIGCKVDVEKENPLVGTTWEAISLKITGDTLITQPLSDYERAILIYGKTHYTVVVQDTSLNNDHFVVGTYTITGDSLTYTMIMYPNYEDIGKTFKFKFQIDGDKMVVTGADMHVIGRDWKTYREEWKKID